MVGAVSPQNRLCATCVGAVGPTGDCHDSALVERSAPVCKAELVRNVRQ